ncbi:colicin Ia central receptor-binding domain-containing protein [Escherichia coli]
MSAEKVFVSGAPRFSGTIKITTNSVIDNRAGDAANLLI